MGDVLKPYLAAILKFLTAHPLILGLSFGLFSLSWYYADTVLNEPLNKYEAVGFFLISYGLLLAGKVGFLGFKRLFKLLFSLLIVVASENSDASELKVIAVPGTGEHDYDLTALSLFQFQFPLSQLDPIDQETLPEAETDCLAFRRRDYADFFARFCGYNVMFNEAIGSIIADTEGNSFYAWDLYDLESGGGANFGAILEIPNTKLRDYMANAELQLEFLSRAFLSRNHEETKEQFVGFGMYGFILFRDRGDFDLGRKSKITEAFLSILPDFSTDSFGIPLSHSGVLIYPTSLSGDEIYTEFHSPTFLNFCDEIDCSEDDLQNSEAGILEFTRRYNYSYASYALKQVSKSTRNAPPSISLIFLPSSSQIDKDKFYISNFDWSKSIIFDITDVNDYKKLFVDINNFFVHGVSSPPLDLFDHLRRFANSTGRLALIAFDKGE